MKILFHKIILLACFVGYTSSTCASYYTCDTCAAYKGCYWCSTSSKCEDYYGEKFADIICPNKWIQHDSLCPAVANTNGGGAADSDLLNLLTNGGQTPLNSLLSGGDNSLAQAQQTSQGSSQELKDLLHKLLLLKLLRKIKAEGTSSLTPQETKLLSQITNVGQQQQQQVVTTTTTTTQSPNMKNEIKKLLNILQKQTDNKAGKGGKEAVTTMSPGVGKTAQNATIGKTIAPSSPPTQKPLITEINKQKATNETVLSLLKKIDEQNAGVEYQENKPESIGKPVAKTKPVVKTTPVAKVTKAAVIKNGVSMNFCKLYEETGLCNSDHNCTWCNTKDVCIRRSDTDYKGCVDAKDRMTDKEFGLDTCLAMKHCKQCVENDKCYWCDVSKSCHTYPFFGYVPHSCGGDWYVKQCDVQLAVIIIVLPLIIILLAMVTFYFCLKYCYYRRKVLRVPLFEKPGVFDYRKDKKVYYVNPEDESSDTELAAEKIRKKYRLPVEREPLIDPNS
eukprot:TCONS_00046362-protein